MFLTIINVILCIYEFIYLLEKGGTLALVLTIAFGANAYMAYLVEKEK